MSSKNVLLALNLTMSSSRVASGLLLERFRRFFLGVLERRLLLRDRDLDLLLCFPGDLDLDLLLCFLGDRDLLRRSGEFDRDRDLTLDSW